MTAGNQVASGASMSDPYERYVEENIFKPAGMTTADPLQNDGINPNVAIRYTKHTGDRQVRRNVLMRGACL